MKISEAKQWLSGDCSMLNSIPREPFETWETRIAQADAAKTEQAYWIVRAENEAKIDLQSTTAEPEPVAEWKPRVGELCEFSDDVRKLIAAWMIQHGYSTGHGETIEDLLTELEWQTHRHTK